MVLSFSDISYIWKVFSFPFFSNVRYAKTIIKYNWNPNETPSALTIYSSVSSAISTESSS